MASYEKNENEQHEDYTKVQGDFIAKVRSVLSELNGEIDERNQAIEERDGFIYGERLESMLDIPIGHDHTPVNWLRRTVEIHKIQFMGRPFNVISTYNTVDESNAEDEKEAQRLRLENKRKKELAELRKNAIDDVIRDNGGHALFMDGAESASAIGDWIVKAWYDEENKKYVLSPIEAVENVYVVWNSDDFRSYDAVAYVYQVSKQRAIEEFGCDEDVATSILGSPLDYVGSSVQTATTSTQPMVTVMEVTGKIPGWTSKNGVLKTCSEGDEVDINVKIVGNYVKQVIDDKKKLPKHYLFPNKRQRRRPWGASDVSDAAVLINLSYVETLSDWRTVGSKVNFPKFKGFNFGSDTQIPKYQPRKIQILPLADGQDIVQLDQGDSNNTDFRSMMDELKEQFVRETGISRVLFDDPSITLNSNQALLTSMKPTSDIAENKKQLWEPVLTEMFRDALDTLAEWDEDFKMLKDDDNWNIKVQWPSVMQKEDPIYQQMLLNRKNAGTISIQSYLEAQGETKEELDRIRDELTDPITAAIHGNMLQLLAEQLIRPVDPNAKPAPKVSVNLRGDLTPMQEAELAAQNGFNSNLEMGPQGQAGLAAYENADNQGFIEGNAFSGGTPVTKNGQQATVAQNQEGQGVVGQPGSGATTSPQGALDQAAQQQGA